MLAYQCQPVFTTVPWHFKILTEDIGMEYMGPLLSLQLYYNS